MRLLSTRELADALDLSESSLKRWIDAGHIRASRTEGGHRRVELAEAMRFIRQSKTRVVRPEILDLPEVAHADKHQRLLEYLLDGDAVGARGWLVARHLEGSSIAQLADGPIRDAMHAIGELWHHDDNGIHIEHRATDTCLQAVAQLRSLATTVSPKAPVALGAAPSGDPYLLSTQLVGMVLAEANMRAINLGPDLPVTALQAAVARHRPKLVWLSVTSEIAPATARAYSAWLAKLPASITVIVGGQQAGSLRNLPPRIQRGSSMADLVTLAKGRA